METTTWLPALGVLVFTLVAAALYLRRARQPALPKLDPALERLQRRLELLMEHLRELDVERHLLPPETFAAQRESLETEAAEALQQRDGFRSSAPPPAATPPVAAGFLAKSPQLKGALWGGGVVLFFVLLGLFLGQDNAPRKDPPSTAGGTSMSPAGDGVTNELSQLRDRLEQAPDDIQAATRAAHLLLREQDIDNAEALTFRVLSLDPFQTESRIHRALLRSARGNTTAAEHDLTHLVETYPDAQEGLMFLGMLQMQRGDKRSALASFERYVHEAPPSDQPPMLSSTLESLRAELAGSSK